MSDIALIKNTKLDGNQYLSPRFSRPERIIPIAKSIITQSNATNRINGESGYEYASRMLNMVIMD